MPSRYQVGAAGSHGFGTPNRTCLAVSGRAAGSHGFGTPNRTCLRGIRTGCRISRVWNNSSNMHTRYQDGAAGSHGKGTSDRTCQVGAAGSHRLGTADSTCLRGIRTGLQDLTGSEHQIVYAYEVSGRGCRISRVPNNKSNIPRRYQDEAAGSHEFGTPYRTCLEGIRTGLQDLTVSEHQIVHAYEISGRSCRFSRVRTSDRTCI